MESINFYKCNKCGALYHDTEEGQEKCIKCENSHVEIKELTGNVVYEKNKRFDKNCPTKIEVEMEDGCKVWYRR